MLRGLVHPRKETDCWLAAQLTGLVVNNRKSADVRRVGKKIRFTVTLSGWHIEAGMLGLFVLYGQL